MKIGHFYYIKDQYFIDFPDTYLMQNKETVNGKVHDRPCFYAFKDHSSGLYWMIPFSSQVSKFKNIYDKKNRNIKNVTQLYLEKYWDTKKYFLFKICVQ